MSKLTRYFLIGSIGFLVVGLSIGVVAYYNGGLKALTTQRGPAGLQYVPRDASVVAFANVRDIMNSNFRQRIKELEAGKGERGQQEFLNETGIDIEKDIDTVLAYMTSTPGAEAKPGGVVMATGRFNQTKIGDLITQKGGSVEKHGDKTLMIFKTSSSEGEGGGLAFLPPDQVAIGSVDAVRAIVAGTAARGGDVTTNTDMLRLIDQVDNGNAWVVGRFDALSSHAHLPPQVASQIPPITWFSATGTVDGGLSGSLSVEATDKGAADNLRAVIEGLKGLAALQARSSNVPPQVQQLLNSFTLSQPNATTVTLQFSIPSEMLDSLATLGGKSGQPHK